MTIIAPKKSIMFRKGGLLVSLAVLALCGRGGAWAADAPTPLQAAAVVETVPAPGGRAGLVFVDDQVWMADPDKGALVRYQAIGAKKARILPLRGISRPRVVTWDGKNLWCAGREPDKVHEVDPATGRVLRTLAVPLQGVTGSVSIEALVWDGKYLWVGYSAGWSSQLASVDVNEGRVVQSFFSEGLPAALASDGKTLWMATYNQGRAPSVLARWTISEDAQQTSRSHAFIARLPGKEPSGLSWDGRALWYADRELKSLQRVQLPTEP